MGKHTKELTPEEVIIAEDALMEFQFAVIDAMREKNMTQVELANMLGISRARVSQMLSSDANPTLKVVGRTLAVLDIETKYVSKSVRHVAISAINKKWENATLDWELPTMLSKPVWHNDNSKMQKNLTNCGIRKAA